MKFINLFCLILAACSGSVHKKAITSAPERNRVVNTHFQTLLDSADVKGTIVIFDPKENTYTSNDFNWAETGFLPASTFKIPNTIIALDLGLLKDENTILRWNEKQHWNEKWNRDLTLREAFQTSCVPCYQEIARNVGVEQMNKNLNSYNYPEMFVDSTNIDQFWLSGKGRITPLQQIEFLKVFNTRGLPIKASTYATTKKIFERESTEDYTLYAKTGWSSGENTENGWFVGFVERGANVYYFATNIEPKGNRPENEYYEARIEVTLAALKALEIISIVRD